MHNNHIQNHHKHNKLTASSVSYTHLDVYKRQVMECRDYYVQRITDTTVNMTLVNDMSSDMNK